MKDVTAWYPGDVKPARDGVYQRNFAGSVMYARFHKGAWMVAWGERYIATAANSTTKSTVQEIEWRGLTAPK